METMNKDTNFSGHPVLSQIIKLINRDKVNELATTTKVNRYVKSFDAFTHLVVMLFGILKHFDSLRELEIGMKAEAHKLGHLGMNYLVKTSPSISKPSWANRWFMSTVVK